MSLFQSGPYRSKILSSVVRQSQRWADKLGVGVRSLKITLSWTTQILLYPVYAAVQTVRLAGAKIQQRVELEAMPPESASSPVSSPSVALTADTAIEQVLLMIQALPLPVKLPIAFPLRSSKLVGTGGEPGAELGLASPDALTGNPAVFVRGLATVLETRSLVLVTNQNHILDVLTPQQQTYLRQRIICEVADYRRFVRAQGATQRLFSRWHLPNPEPLLQPVRQAWRSLQGWLQSAPVAWLPETPLQHTLAIVQQLPLREELPVWLPQLGGLVMSGDPACAVIPSAPSAIQASHTQVLSQPLSGAGELTAQNSADPAHLPPVYIRAVATVLETRSLVLVTNQNVILDVLTLQQQEQIRRKITWEVALYQRYHQIQRTTQRALARLHPATKTSPVLPPVRVFQRLMSWVQTSPVAIAANLFQEARLAEGTDSPPPPTLPPAYRFRQPRSIQMQQFQRYDSGSLFYPDAEQGDAAPDPETALSPQHSSQIARSFQASSHLESTPASDYPDYIDTQATPVGYIQPWWEKCLRWLDQTLFWLEQTIVNLVKAIRRGRF
jgi:hypothetical protein